MTNYKNLTKLKQTLKKKKIGGNNSAIDNSGENKTTTKSIGQRFGNSLVKTFTGSKTKKFSKFIGQMRKKTNKKIRALDNNNDIVYKICKLNSNYKKFIIYGFILILLFNFIEGKVTQNNVNLDIIVKIDYKYIILKNKLMEIIIKLITKINKLESRISKKNKNYSNLFDKYKISIDNNSTNLNSGENTEQVSNPNENTTQQNASIQNNSIVSDETKRENQKIEFLTSYKQFLLTFKVKFTERIKTETIQLPEYFTNINNIIEKIIIK